MTTKTTLKILLIATFLPFTLFCFGNYTLAVGSPQVQTNPASNVQNTSVILNGNLSDLGGYGFASVWFQFGVDSNYVNTTSPVNQSYAGNFSQQVFNLAPNQTFHYRAVAQNGYGIYYGQDVTFFTGPIGASQITVNAGPSLYLVSGQSGVLQGYAYDSGGSYLNFLWTCTGGSLSNYNIVQPTYTAPNINQYSSQVTYTCRLTATNASGQSNFGQVNVYVNYSGNNYAGLNVQTNPATYTYNNQATLNGYVNGGSLYNLYGWFEWGTDTNYGYQSLHQALQYSGSFTQNIANLTANQVYHYRAVAQNNYGIITYGQDMTFVSTGYTTSYIPPINPTFFSTATNISTGLTNDILTDSFFLPLILIVVVVWIWRSKMGYNIIKQLKFALVK